MIRRTASVLGRRRPLVLRVPLLTPRLSSYRVALVTPVEMGAPIGFDDAVQAALA